MDLLNYTDGMTQAQQAAFYAEFADKKRDPTTALLLSFFLGGVGAHKYYGGNDRLGLAYLLFCWTLVPTALGILEAPFAPGRARRQNRAIAEDLSRKVRVRVRDLSARPQGTLALEESEGAESATPTALPAPARMPA